MCRRRKCCITRATRVDAQPGGSPQKHLHLPHRPSFWTGARSAALGHAGRIGGAGTADGARRSAEGGAGLVTEHAKVDAVILVGGKGTRLRPLTLSVPKPMLPTAGLPFLTHLLSRIAAAGIEHVILGTSYHPAAFEKEFGDGSQLGLQIEYVTEESPLGTGGGIANVVGKLRHDTVMVFNGDVLSGADLRQLLG